MSKDTESDVKKNYKYVLLESKTHSLIDRFKVSDTSKKMRMKFLGIIFFCVQFVTIINSTPLEPSVKKLQDTKYDSVSWIFGNKN